MDPVEREQLLQYGRHYGLLDSRPVDDIHLLATAVLPPGEFTSKLDDTHLVINDAATISCLHEKLEVPKDAAILLQSALSLPQSANDVPEVDERRRQLRHVKFEQPLLQTDHDFDIKNFLKTRADRPILDNYTASLYQLESESDEALHWSSEQLGLPDQIWKTLNTERLGVSSSAFELLGSAIDAKAFHSSSEQAITDDRARYRMTTFRQLTPPLLPASPVPAIQSSSPIADFVEPIEYTSPVSHELGRIRSKIAASDKLVTGSQEHGPDTTSSSPTRFLCQDVLMTGDTEKQSPLTSPTHQPRLWEFKLEGPLTPNDAISASKSVSFSDVVDEIKPLALVARQEIAAENDEAAIDELFKEIIEPTAFKARYEVEHEQLHAADTTLRMDVPSLDMTIPEPPWQIAMSSEAQQREISDLMLSVSRLKLHHWPGVGKLELDLPWAPFRSELGEVSLKEALDDHGSISKLTDVTDYGDALDIDSLTWKPEGLRIFDGKDDDDEEITGAPAEGVRIRCSPLGKRHPLNEKLGVCDGQKYRNASVWPYSENDRVTRHRSDKPNAEGPHTEPTDAENSIFSAPNELNRFMAMQGMQVKKRKRDHESFIPTDAEDNSAERYGSDYAQALPHALEATRVTKLNTTDELMSLPLPDEAHGSRSIIISSGFAARRNVIRHINLLWPSLVLIERDWCLHMQARHQHNATDCDEGDIVVSSAHTLICTTIAKISQKPLPGQGQDSVLQSRLKATVRRFERVSVLVGAVQGGQLGQLDSHHARAYSDLINFCTSLDAHVSVFLASGTEKDLARWIICSICSNTPLLEDVKLLQEITYWELYLRRAGLNTFATQGVLSELKGANLSQQPSSFSGPAHGLVAFIAMSGAQRIDRFEELMGGRRVLSTVNEVLDTVWTAHESKISG